MTQKGVGPVAAVWSENALERARLRRLLAANCCASLAYDSAAGMLKLLASGKPLSMIVIGETSAGASDSTERIRLLVNPRTAVMVVNKASYLPTGGFAQGPGLRALDEKAIQAKVKQVLAKVRAAGSIAPSPLSFGNYEFRPPGQVLVENEPKSLSDSAFSVALTFFRNQNTPLSEARLDMSSWDEVPALSGGPSETMTEHLRTLLELDGRHGFNLQSLLRSGYVLTSDTGRMAQRASLSTH
ncbi:MAG: DNA-binding response regulator [Variovorax sp.]|jgi:hypothetical protein|nr:DNA-binding response regulator [Variovorax sp.]